ncbi:abscisic acid-deficient protein Aba4 family protein [Streptomyces sp. BI20]|uniref:abscisic acid-deficient protein Aba4 family protein n=1 Tax=Streptomyces sp. BI20 TaxID=3403460 RepID=UPI003C766651
MSAFLFTLSFLLAAPVWALMILAPGLRLTARIAASPLTAVPVALVYAVLGARIAPELWALVTGPDLAGFQALAADASGAGAAAAWAHIIAWDLLVGQWMYRESRRLGIAPWVSGPVLLLTILLAPVGLLVFLPLRALAGRAARRREPARLAA